MPQIIAVQSGQEKVTASGPQFGVKYTLTGPDGARAVFNDPGDPDYVGHISNMTGMDSPEVRESADDLIGDDGGVHGEFFYGRRPITIEGLIDNRPGSAHYEARVVRELHRNLFPNPRFANDVNGWIGISSGGFASITEGRAALPVAADRPGEFGWRSAATMPADATVRTAGFITTSGQAIPIVEGRTYTVIADIYVASVTGTVTHRFDRFFYDAAGAQVASATGSGGPNLTTGWTRSTQTFTAPTGVGAITARINPEFRLDASGEAIDAYVTNLMLVEGDTAPDYFDGGTLPGGTPQATSWVGAAHNSVSILNETENAPFDANRVRNIRLTKLARVTNALRKDMTMRWTPEGGVEQTLSVRRNQPLRYSGSFNKAFQVALVAADPRIYAVKVNEVSILPAVNTVNLENQGTATTPPSVVLYGPATNPVLTNFSTGESLSLTYTLTAGNYLVIDFRNKTIMLNGTTNVFSALNFGTSIWWFLRPGLNNIRWSATSTTSASSMRVQWQDAWV